MINALKLIGFKSFINEEIPLKRLTVLTGTNSTGKSSVIQALLMLEKAFLNEHSILLEGYGSLEEIRNKFFSEEMVISVADENKNPFLIKVPISNSDAPYSIVSNENFTFPELTYISANRYGPRTSVPIYQDNNKRKKIGPNGENVLQCIEILRDEPLDKVLRHENSEGETLFYNIKGWLSVISPNTVFDYKVDKITDSSYATFNDHRSANVGFGLSYSLPVITAALMGTINKNSLVIIENPEAHLHPKGQSEIAKLLCLCANVGAQVIIETHSDHIINGILVSCKKFEEDGVGISKDFVQLFHFIKETEKQNSKLVDIEIRSGGKIAVQPEDFFDQVNKDLNQLLGF